jgi:uncharacterized delta-60 repeat protein
MSLRIVAAACALAFSTLATAEGSLDTDFGAAANGRVVLPFDLSSPPSDQVADLLIDSDDRLYLIGPVRDANGDLQTGLARLRTDGRLDPTFGVQGQRVTSFSTERVPVAAAFGSDGNILVASRLTDPTATGFSVCNHSITTGQAIFLPGSTFACASYTPVAGRQNYVNDIVVQPDGKIVLIGYSRNLANKPVGAVMRLNPDGSRDMSFSGNGQATYDLGDSTQLTAGTWDAYGDDGIALCGTMRRTNFSHDDIVVVRLLAQNGEYDPNFNGQEDGWRAYDFDLGAYSEGCNAITADRGGSLYPAGYAYDNVQLRGAIFRIAPGSNPILQFGFTVIATGTSFNIGDVVLRSNGRPVVAGTRWQNGQADWHVIALRDDGTPDPAFGSNGSRTIDFTLPGQNDYVAGLAIQNTRVVVAGSVLAGGANTYDFAAARLDADVIFANSFAN